MTLHGFVELIVAFVREHETWAAPIAFGVAFLESFCFLSIIWPGTAILIAISGLLAAGGVGIDVLWPAIIAAGVGGYGAQVSFTNAWVPAGISGGGPGRDDRYFSIQVT